MKISIVTATYNRGYLLDQLYQSLIHQVNHPFTIEWIVIDDGSTDQTAAIVNRFIKEKRINIAYHYQENQGKMKAINQILSQLTSDYYLECDSDDYLKKDALFNIGNHLSLFNDQEIGALIFEKENAQGQLLGNGLMSEKQGRMVDFYYRWGMSGDKALVFKTELRKKYPFKFEENESFSPEGRLYHQINLNCYLFTYLPIALMVCAYQASGYTRQAQTVHRVAPLGHFKYYQEVLRTPSFKPTLAMRYHLIKQYLYFSFLAKISLFDAVKKINRFIDQLFVMILYLPAKIRYYVTYKK